MNFDFEISDLGFSIISLNKHMGNKDCQKVVQQNVFLWLFFKAMGCWKGCIEESVSNFLCSFPTDHSHKLVFDLTP